MKTEDIKVGDWIDLVLRRRGQSTAGVPATRQVANVYVVRGVTMVRFAGGVRAFACKTNDVGEVVRFENQRPTVYEVA